MAPRIQELAGRKFHKLTAVDRAGFRIGAKCRKTLWRCLCDCGREAIVAQVDLLSGGTKSCGCIIGKHKRTHGGTGTAEFRIWDLMRRRCSDSKHRSYKDYGGRGISVCERWKSDFATFLADMGPRPSPDHSIDRIKNDGNYEPDNCRWATRIEQSNNRRSSRFLTIGGETKTLAQWERQVGLNPGVLFRRLQAGWAPDRLLIPSRLPSWSRAREAAATNTTCLS